jgi:hypothetical protein
MWTWEEEDSAEADWTGEELSSVVAEPPQAVSRAEQMSRAESSFFFK